MYELLSIYIAGMYKSRDKESPASEVHSEDAAESHQKAQQALSGQSSGSKHALQEEFEDVSLEMEVKQ